MPCMNNMLPVLITKNVPQKDNMFNINGNMDLIYVAKIGTLCYAAIFFLDKSEEISLI